MLQRFDKGMQISWLGFLLKGVQKSYHKPLNGGSNYFPWKSIWTVTNLPRVSFFSWYVMLGITLIMDNLRKRNIIIMDWCLCVKYKVRVCLIFFSMVWWLVNCGLWSFACSGLPRLCLMKFLLRPQKYLITKIPASLC